MKRESNTLWVLVPVTLFAFTIGCSRLSVSRHPGWQGSQIHSQPCKEATHQHEGAPREAETLKAVDFDLTRYQSAQLRADQDPNLAVAIAISGGGERSGNFALGVLLGLERLPLGSKTEPSNLLLETDYFSTVSGGGMAVAGYISELLAHNRSGRPNRDFRFEESICESGVEGKERDDDKWLYKHMRRDYHKHLLLAWTEPKVVLSGIDRGDVLESKWDKRLLGNPEHWTESLRLGDVFIPVGLTEKRPTVPYWIANATVLGNGAIFPFTPDVIEQYGVKEYVHRLDKKELHCAYDLPLAVGLKASASFPGAIAATTLGLGVSNVPTYLHLSDGGLSDNLAVWTALRALKQDNSKQRLLIVIDAYSGDGLPFDKSPYSPSALKVVSRTTGISLDSWRGRHRKVVESFTTPDNIKVIFLSFDELLVKLSAEGVLNAECQKVLRRSLACDEIPKAPRNTDEEFDFEKELNEIRKKARETKTNLDIKPNEQRALVRAGELVVCLMKDAILQSVRDAKTP